MRISVKIRPAKMQDFNNHENPSGISTGSRFYLKQEDGRFKAYRINESTRKEKLQAHIDRELVWVPYTGFESEVEIINPTTT